MTAAMTSAVRINEGREIPSPSDIAMLARPLARQYGIGELYLFGSMASGDAGPDSDVDFIYGTTHDDMRVRRVSNFRSALRDAFDRDIDLVDIDYITQPERKPYDEMIRSLFVRNVMSKPILRILPTDDEERS